VSILVDALLVPLETAPSAPFEEATLWAQYVRPLASSVTIPASPALIGEHVRAELLEVRPDGTRALVFEVLLADEARGLWVARARRGEPTIPRSGLMRLTEGLGASAKRIPLDTSGDSTPVARAYWLGEARRGWRARFDPGSDAAACARSLAGAADSLADVGWVQLQHARACLVAGDLANAEAALARSAALGEDVACDRARLLLARNQPEDAVLALEGVGNGRAAALRAAALRALGRLGEAIAVLREMPSDCTALSEWALEGGPGRAGVLLAEVLWDAGHLEDAAAQFERVGQRIERAKCLEALGRLGEALRVYETCRDQRPEVVEHVLRVERALSLRARPRGAPRRAWAFELGDIVSHAKLGRGEVVDVDEGTVVRVTVRFEGEAGTRTVPAGQLRVPSAEGGS